MTPSPRKKSVRPARGAGKKTKSAPKVRRTTQTRSTKTRVPVPEALPPLPLAAGAYPGDLEKFDALVRAQGLNGLTEDTATIHLPLEEPVLIALAQQLEEIGRVRILSFRPMFVVAKEAVDFLGGKLVGYIEAFHLTHLKEPGSRVRPPGRPVRRPPHGPPAGPQVPGPREDAQGGRRSLRPGRLQARASPARGKGPGEARGDVLRRRLPGPDPSRHPPAVRYRPAQAGGHAVRAHRAAAHHRRPGRFLPARPLAGRPDGPSAGPRAKRN